MGYFKEVKKWRSRHKNCVTCKNALRLQILLLICILIAIPCFLGAGILIRDYFHLDSGYIIVPIMLGYFVVVNLVAYHYEKELNIKEHVKDFPKFKIRRSKI